MTYVWLGYVCVDCGRRWRWSHRCKVSHARFTTYNRLGKDTEPFGIKAVGPQGFRLPTSEYAQP